MKSVLVAAADYPNNDGGVSLMYVHVRNKYYVAHGIQVTVLNFKCNEEYVYEGIRVIGEKVYKAESTKYDILICHASNLRNHYRFLKNYGKRFEKFIFFFHGHEIMKLNKSYPEDYSFVKKNYFKKMLQSLYDNFKLRVWRKYLPKVANKSKFVFVSSWFKKVGLSYLKLTEEDLLNNVTVINNSTGEIFEKQNYNYNFEKEYDFISIRSFLDKSKYCVDIIVKLAEKYPQYKFLLVGKGEYFVYNEKPANLIWKDTYLNHEEMLKLIDKSYCALIPTRLDAQGVMACEFATYGIPVITSDIDVCKEICGKFKNVAYISNDANNVELESIYQSLIGGVPYEKELLYGYQHTVKKEEDIIRG